MTTRMTVRGRPTAASLRLVLTALLLLASSSSVLIGSRPARSAAQDTKVIYVDQTHSDADDANPGTGSRPLATLGAALALADAYNAESVPVRIIIRPGIYRESGSLAAEADATSAPISLEGIEPGVVVSGSDVWQDWQEEADGVYSHTWPYDWGLAALPETWPEQMRTYLNENPIIRRGEMVFVNRDPLLQVLHPDELRSTENSFYVSEETDELFINVPSDVDLAATEIEVSVRTNLLAVGSRQNVSIQNITFQHAASPLTSSAVRISNSENVDVIANRFIWNNGRGLGISESANILIQGVEANSNGVNGFSGYRVHALHVVDSEASFNGWRASRGWDTSNHESPVDLNFIDFAAGQKFFGLRESVFRDYRAIENLTGGLWLDFDNSGVTLEGLTLRGNLTHGLFLEASQGPISVQESQICGNETGILVGNASDVRIAGNVISGNELGQLFLVGARGPRTVVAHDTGEQIAVQTENWIVEDNIVAVDDGNLAFATNLDDALWSTFIHTLTAEKNRYSSPRSPQVFQLPGGRSVSLEQWRAETGQDEGSTFSPGRWGCPAPGGVSAAVDSRAAPPLMIRLLVAAIIAGLVLVAFGIARLRRS